MAEVKITLPSGKVLQTFINGSPSDPLLIFHHGIPSGGPERENVLQPALAAGFRLAEVFRPGYLYSEPQPGRTLHDVVDWNHAVLDHLGLDRFAVAGYSGGGPFALASAALMPQECVAAMVIAGVGPTQDPSLDFDEGLPPENGKATLFPGDGSEAAMREELIKDQAMVAALTHEEFMNSIASDDGPDGPLRRANADVILKGYKLMMATSLEGLVEDSIILREPWGVDISSIQQPTVLLCGRMDKSCPIQHSEWFASKIAHAKTFFTDGDAHASIMANVYPEALKTLSSLVERKV